MKEITLFIDQKKRIKASFVENVPQDHLVGLKKSVNLPSNISKEINESEDPEKYFDCLATYVEIGYKLAKAANLGQIPPLKNGIMKDEDQLKMLDEMLNELQSKHETVAISLLATFICGKKEHLTLRNLFAVETHYVCFNEMMLNLFVPYGIEFYQIMNLMN